MTRKFILLGWLLLGPPAVAMAQDQTVPSIPAINVTVKEIVEYDEYTGRFDAINRVEVRARVSGYLAKIEFQEGQLVKTGDLLAVVDQRPFKIALDAAKASLGEVLAALDLAKIEASRARSLRADRAVSQEEVDQREQEEIAAAARVAGAQAAVDQAELDLSFTEIRASIPGRVGRREIDVGNLIAGGNVQASLITTIVQEDPIHFYFEVSESDFLRYARLNESGARPTSRTTPNAISIRLLDEDEFLHHGVMDFVDNELDPTSGTLEGRAVVSNTDGFLQPGVFGRLRLLGSGLYEAKLIPDQVIQFDQSRQFVLTVDGQGNVNRQFIEPGPIVDGLRVIRSGLEGDETLVSGAFHRVRPGMTVSPQFEDAVE